jgi:hypothetical protein
VAAGFAAGAVVVVAFASVAAASAFFARQSGHVQPAPQSQVALSLQPQLSFVEDSFFAEHWYGFSCLFLQPQL